jgi:hypothetical protein
VIDHCTNAPQRNATAIPVKLLNRLVRPFYSVERRSSVEQLRADFGDFPPAPLRCAGIAGELDVVRIRGIGELYYQLIMINRMLRGIESDTQLLSADFIEFFGAGDLLALRSVFDAMGRRARCIKPMMIAFVLGAVGVKLAVRMIRSAHKETRTLGCFVPIRKNESNILVKVARHRKSGRGDAPTISHEHIHLLQHKDSEGHARSARSPETLLTPKGLAAPFLLYLLEKKEVEARLHESVLSFYRFHKRLPVTVPEFLGLLAASRQYGEVVRWALDQSGVGFDREVEAYPEREDMYAEQLEFILIYIRTPELTCRFLTEVLPVMYGNLLRYYGDEAASESYLKDIDRPNFYDELYGLQAA